MGLQSVAAKRVGGFSLGMGQRLGIAAALLGDPRVLILDEPVNGLDPEGILWVRNLMKRLAEEGRTVFVSSHLISEISVTAEHLIVIGRGKLVADCSTAEFIERHTEESVLVKSPDTPRLREAVTAEGGRVSVAGDGAVRLRYLVRIGWRLVGPLRIRPEPAGGVDQAPLGPLDAGALPFWWRSPLASRRCSPG